MKITSLALAAALVVLPLWPSAVADDASHDAAVVRHKNIVQTAAEAGSFATLLLAAKTAGLAEALTGAGPFTVFAPTDAAFDALPEGTVAALLEPVNRDQLRRILSLHVVAGRVRSADLLPTTVATSLAGEELRFGLRVGRAGVTQADIECSNGVIHVIDAVLLPTASPEEETDMAVRRLLSDAIDRGVPLFNEGDEAGCAGVYRETARGLLQRDDLAALHRSRLVDALAAPAADASAEAWTLRSAFDGMLADLAFEPRIEAPVPEGFPEPGPVGRVVRKEYPAYRAARAEGQDAFWQLFEHIKQNDIPMTAPVEMTLGDDERVRDMAFLYERSTQGAAGEQGVVAVLDLEPLVVMSIGMRGRRDASSMARARRVLTERLAADGVHAAGPWRTLGYNSPMVPAAQQYWELQVPVAEPPVAK